MINIKFKKTESSDLEKEIARLFEVMADKQPTDADYEKVAGIGQILLITNFEHAHALASKSLGFVFKSRA
jgi:sporulation protein YlmC with PRC-barrel domain